MGASASCKTWRHKQRSGDMYAEDSINLLKRSGINFDKCETDGIDVMEFGELLVASGLVLMEDVTWISFQGYMDFGYLLKILTCQALPESEAAFLHDLELYFPKTYDIKYLMKSCKSLKGGLQDVADDLNVDRIGPQHQAGSDSLLTCITFFRMRKVQYSLHPLSISLPRLYFTNLPRCPSTQMFFEDNIDTPKYLNFLYGLGASMLT